MNFKDKHERPHYRLKMTYIVEEAKLVSSCFNWPSSASPLLSC